ncbi:MAG TPA: hypothetical protein PKO06_05220 [Candidatus Ozemobacteraceae bacterium]|nr:hypothetical protein [Candidatus Ozemobacteraceae bacterium]
MHPLIFSFRLLIKLTVITLLCTGMSSWSLSAASKGTPSTQTVDEDFQDEGNTGGASPDEEETAALNEELEPDQVVLDDTTMDQPLVPQPTPENPSQTPTSVQPTDKIEQSLQQPLIAQESKTSGNWKAGDRCEATGVLKYHDSRVMSVESFKGHEFTINRVPVKPTAKVSIETLKKHVGKKVHVSGTWDAGTIFTPNPKEPSAYPTDAVGQATGDGILVDLIELK